MTETMPLTSVEAAQEIADWMAEAIEKIGRNELDQSVLTLCLRGSIVRLEARVTRRGE